jgi:hypothetical protein
MSRRAMKERKPLKEDAERSGGRLNTYKREKQGKGVKPNGDLHLRGIELVQLPNQEAAITTQAQKPVPQNKQLNYPAFMSPEDPDPA